MNKHSKILLRFAALFAVVGVFLGSHMAGSGPGKFLTVHAHILVVGWLSLFAFSVYHQIFTPQNKLLSAIQVWTAIIGSIGLTVGMWFRYVQPFGIEGAFPLVFFIVGGTILLISFAIFLLLTFMKTEADK